MEAFLSSDKYQYTMGHTFNECGMKDKKAVFNMFYRKAPDGNGWAVVAGINEVINMVKDMGKYPKEYYKKFLTEEHYDKYCELLANTKFTGDLYAMREGEIAFPNQPIIKVVAPLLEAQLIETPALAIMNHQMAIATKASRVVRSTNKPVSEFGSRRAHGTLAAEYGSKAAYIAGCVNTSNILTKIEFDVPCTGTMAHSYVTAFGVGPKAELESFKAYIETHQGEALVLLIDTYDTLKCGVKNAIKAFKEYGITNDYTPSFGVRLDSGDMTYLSIGCRKMLDEAGYTNAKIFATNGLDENLIQDIEREGAVIDCYGVGDAIAMARSIGLVYKLTEIDGEPLIKLSEDKIKVTNPGNLLTVRVYSDETGCAEADITCIDGDATFEKLWEYRGLVTTAEDDKTKTTKFKEGTYDIRVLQRKVIENGKIVKDAIFNTEQAKIYHEMVKGSFNSSHLRLTNPHRYKVNISDELETLKVKLIKEIKSAIDEM